MQEKTTIARPYAQAAFAVASEENELQQWSELLHLLGRIVSDPDMIKLIKNPELEREKLADFIFDICADYLSDTRRNFIIVLAEPGRLLVAPEIHALFENLRGEAEGIVDVKVTSAYQLEDDQQQKIRQMMSSRLGKDVNISSETDDTLIGGVVIRAGDSVIDASIKGRLKQLSQYFAE